jgi:hypothetical protein
LNIAVSPGLGEESKPLFPEAKNSGNFPWLIKIIIRLNCSRYRGWMINQYLTPDNFNLQLYQSTRLPEDDTNSLKHTTLLTIH